MINMLDKIKQTPAYQNYARILPYVKPYWFRALLAVLICVPIGALDAVIALALRPYMDLVMVEKSLQSSWLIPCAIVAFTCFQGFLNYVATYLVAFFLLTWTPDGSSTLGRMEDHGVLPVLFGNEYLLIIIVVAILTIAMYVYLNYTKQGYEISVVGESENTARYIGISVPKIIIRTMIVSGAICGLAGFLIVGGLDRTITTESAGGQGFTAIMVSWLAKFNPLVMILTSFLLIFLDQGAAQVAQKFDMSDAFPSIITGIILFFIIGCEFFINYKVVFRASKKEGQV